MSVIERRAEFHRKLPEARWNVDQRCVQWLGGYRIGLTLRTVVAVVGKRITGPTFVG